MVGRSRYIIYSRKKRACWRYNFCDQWRKRARISSVNLLFIVLWGEHIYIFFLRFFLDIYCEHVNRFKEIVRLYVNINSPVMVDTFFRFTLIFSYVSLDERMDLMWLIVYQDDYVTKKIRIILIVIYLRHNSAQIIHIKNTLTTVD